MRRFAPQEPGPCGDCGTPNEECQGPTRFCCDTCRGAWGESHLGLTERLAGPLDLLLGRRCRAHLPSGHAGPDEFFGRCELRRHDNYIAHALERGMYWVRWQGSDDTVTNTWSTP